MVELKRLNNESDEEVIYRICMAKEEIGTWQEVANALNNILGNEYTESKYRKQFQAFNKIMNANSNKILQGNDYAEDLENTRKELHKERIKLQTLNIERNRLDREEARQELFYEHVGAVCEALPVPEFVPLANHTDNMNYVLTIADVHYGADFKTINNEYSREIAKQRFEYLAARVQKFVEDKHIKKLWVVSLGDMLQGILRVSDLRLNDTSLVKCLVEISRLISSFLNEISKYVSVEYYHTGRANHTQLRCLGTKASALPEEDLEYVLGNYIYDALSNNNRVNVHLQDEPMGFIDIELSNNNTLCAMHGHQIRNFENAIKDIEALTGRYYSALLLGHYHSGKEMPVQEGDFGDKEVLISSSFIGSDPYSESIFKGTKAACKIYGFNGGEGHVESYKIILN